MTRDDWARYEKIRHKPEVVEAMRARCEEQGHEYEMGVSILMQVSHVCKWCGERR